VSTVITPPPGYGTSFVVDRVGPAQRRRDTILLIVFYALVGAGFTFTRGFFWPALVILALGTWLHITVRNGGWIAAGPEWLKKAGGQWVATDRLVRVCARETTGGTWISMEDADGRRLEVRLGEMTRTPEVWRTFAAALRRSLERGVQIDVYTAGRLTAADFTGTLHWRRQA
jgi:hypothetical protein